MHERLFEFVNNAVRTCNGPSHRQQPPSPLLVDGVADHLDQLRHIPGFGVEIGGTSDQDLGFAPGLGETTFDKAGKPFRLFRSQDAIGARDVNKECDRSEALIGLTASVRRVFETECIDGVGTKAGDQGHHEPQTSLEAFGGS
ncbi:hypothetical protein ASF60_09960 [Methylobacterium sp. Leaf113]|nr:hypothetical protein ASF60_09960 [Methylobacterium sp. Leaf113]